MDKQAIKPALFEFCADWAEQRFQTASRALQQAREASNDDTKSSAGDKFETSREMMQQEIDRNKKLLLDAEDLKRALLPLKDSPASRTVRRGSVAFTDQGNFYVAISAGQITVNSQNYFAVSPASPIGKMLLGQSEGSIFEFNGKTYTISEVL